MTAVGIIAEFNPLHTGHLLLFDRARDLHRPIVCVMSGNFVQRGEPAIFDSFTRAEAAIAHGADLVLELPVVYSLSSASGFAFGAVSTLCETGVVDTLLFGSESGDLDALQAAAECLLHEENYRERIRKNLSLGMTYPAAQASAFGSAGEILKTPNNRLGAEYLCALMRRGSSIESATVKREKQAPAASCVRQALLSRNSPKENLIQTDQKPVGIQDFEAMLLYRLRTLEPRDFLPYHDVNRELAARLYEGGRQASLLSCLSYIKTKRYTMSRVKRILFNILIGNLIAPTESPQYLRVLAMNQTGAALLKEIKERAKLPLITILPKKQLPAMLKTQLFASDLYAVAAGKPAGEEYRHRLTVL